MEWTKGGPTKNGPIEWTTAFTDAFQQIKALIAKEIVLAYPDFSKKITIHTDTSNVQLGAVVMQECKMLDFNLKNYLGRK